MRAVQTSAAVAPRYLVKLSVVPDDSDRWKAAMVASGRVAPGLIAAMAGSFHLVIAPVKIFAVTSGVEDELVQA